MLWIYDQGEPAVSYIWTSRVWENTQLKFKTTWELLIILEEFIEYTPINKGKPEAVNM